MCGGGGLSTLSWAGGGACPASPVNFDAEACQVGGTDVCGYVGTTWTCDLQARGGAVTLTLVEDFNAGTQLEAWGEVGGTKFCCATGVALADKVLVLGTDYADNLSFNWDAGTYNLGVGSTNITEAEIYGYEGADIISGSDSTVATYAESFYGGDGPDLIKGKDGEDVIYGEDGEDTLMGFGGDDYMSGGPENDTMTGGAGDDIMDGDEGRDLMSGQDDDDLMDGGPGADAMCGGAETGAPYDRLYAGDSDDESPFGDSLWPSAPTTDTADCGGATNTRYGQSGIYAPNGCSSAYLLTTQPAACP